MFKKILIANRGEIACRVMRSARDMNIATVAVYSEADDGALHMREADEAVCIGPPAAAESYLQIDKIIAAVRETGADAVHPGYGFLSENAGFADRLAAEGIAFIGPSSSAIASMGDKIAAKKVAEKAGVHTIPGHGEAITDATEAAAIAAEIGYPVMIKAAAGGGGKGMRVAASEDVLADNIASAIHEASTAFGDGRVFIEKFIEEPRHIEIQILADGHGNVVHLGERECSIQRRHQKIIEESPSPLLDEATRAAMGAEACALAKEVNYSSAGTVEFVADQSRNFYFLEMNTRLQVEHPVTEYVTGIDLVEQQIRIAAGEKLSLSQDDIKQNGWSVECRLYAEDPARGFMPSIGRLVRYREPEASAAVRIDTGVFEGGEISMFYDPMIAKLVSHGKDRAAAIAAMLGALDNYQVHGISHNLTFLSAILGHTRFAAGNLSTAFIDEEYPDGFAPLAGAAELAVLVPVAALIETRLSARRAGPVAKRDYTVSVADTDHGVTLVENGTGATLTWQGRKQLLQSDWRPGEMLFQGSLDGTAISVQVVRNGSAMRMSWRGAEVTLSVRSPRAAELAARMPKREPTDLSRFLLSPMPGLVVSIAVNEGDEVQAGQALAVVDAMKMENVLRAERQGVVAEIKVAQGDSLSVDQVIMEFA
ncbi:MAG: acetyl/propionyl/methylcrotonyl-CoA carboxylase subunit alpha [Rhodospirillaceae bacterium]|nr:acetyl/propionyl/methylcrotonyl-CoA carboxylase subunit alpha [Rhodospirillaceae bacterium]